MKKSNYKILLFVLLTLGMSPCGFGQNVKVLDLTSNTYTSGNSFYVPFGSSMQVTSNWTFEGWVYVDNKGSGEFPVIMDRRHVFSMFLIDNADSDYAVRFVARDDSDNIIASLRSDGSDGSNDIEMSFDSWNHIAVSRDGTTARLFINGALAQSSTDPDFVLSTPSSNAVNYGARYWGSYSRLLDGALDEMRYSDIARYTAPFSISTASAPHPTSGDNNAILLFNFDASDLANTTSANSYTATANGTLTYTNWDGLTEALPLPITYHRSLSVTTSGHTSKLSWATASEINNQGFEIQRSTDSKTWEKIGFVPGAGNSNKIQSYEFTDRQPASTNYYRLKQQDFDGHEKFSHIVSAFFAKANVSVYPNPVTDVLYVNSADESMAYRIFDITGKMMVAGTTNDGLVSVSSLSKGSYILNLTSKTGNLSLKFQVE